MIKHETCDSVSGSVSLVNGEEVIHTCIGSVMDTGKRHIYIIYYDDVRNTWYHFYDVFYLKCDSPEHTSKVEYTHSI